MIAKKLMKIKKTNKIDVKGPLFHNAEDLRHKASMILELNCKIKIFGFENKDHLREYTKDLNNISNRK